MALASEVQRVYDGFSEQEQEIFNTIVSIAYKINPSFQNRIQWKVPTFTLNDNWHHWIFNLAKTKSGMTLTFHKGWLLEDPKKMLSGDGKHLRMLRFTHANEIKKEILKNLLQSAIRHQTEM